MHGERRWLAWALALPLVACRPALPPAAPPVASPRWNDDDRHPFAGAPSDDGAGLVWDGFDQTILRPAAQFLAVDVGGEAANVNAADEVAGSSWFTNRIGLFPLDPEELAAGPCTNPPLDPADITIVQSKLDGASPGFVVKGTNGIRYLMKLDGPEQAPRPTAADVIASKLLYAAGFTTPCNRVVFFDRKALRIDKKATAKTWTGAKEPFTEAHLDLSLTYAARLADGRYRASVSEWLEGKPIGPWRYHGVRDDDPNDVVPHEDRRELRGLRLLAAWLGHSDARSRNTLDVWMPAGKGGLGFLRHDLVDFSDCFGSVWEPPEMGRRFGHSYWFDVGDIATDFVSLGAIERPWDRARLGRTGKVFGYFDVDSFEPERWVMEYPNPAFSRMTERDSAWMARIIAQLSAEHVERAIRTGRLGDPALERELLRVLLGRRDKILRRYLLGRVSALGLPVLSTHARGDVAVCTRDLAVATGLTAARAHTATVSTRPGAALFVRTERSGENVCVDLSPGELAHSPSIAITTIGARSGPLVVRIGLDGMERPVLVRVERPYGS